MTDIRLDWRDTLKELGVMGLVPEPSAFSPQPAAPGPSPAALPVERARPAAPQPSPARPQAPPALRPQAAPYAPPADPGACPSPEAVAAAGTLAELEACIQGCLACPLGLGRMRFVFGEGDPAARLMFIGEGPGRDEDLQGRPFVGKAGELLDKMIGALGLTRQQVYIANIVKCRPPDNRVPTPQEAAACLGHLRRQIELVRPGVIVTLGATPLRELAGESAGITKVRGQWRRVRVGDRDIPVMPTFHPAYVLRQYTPEVRKAVWEDLKAAQAWLERPEPA
jgi:DNA polymerase